MKKSKLSLGLVTGFVASLALAGCGSVKAKENSLVSFTGYDAETKFDISIDKMYDDYRKDSSVISTYYDRVLEVLIRDYFQTPGVKLSKDYETIKGTAEENLNAAKVKATETARTNGTSYDTEWDAVLESEGVEDEDELLEKYIYNLEKEVLEDELYSSLTKGTEDTLKKEWIEGAFPYHIRHILSKVESGASDYARGTITEAQAKSLSDVGLALGLSNDTFGGVAQRLSEDDGSAKLYGDVGLVTNKASSTGSFSMVTEFQLAIYIFDALYANNESPLVSDESKAAFENTFGASHITKVPYEVFKLLASKDSAYKGYGDVTTKDNKIVGEGEEAVYPRNILWNKYLNHHEPFVITNELVGDVYDGAIVRVDGENPGNTDITKVKSMLNAFVDQTPSNGTTKGRENYKKYDPSATAGAGSAITTNEGKTGFRTVTLGGEQQEVLTDEEGNVIFGVRSEYGIHFISIKLSPLTSDLDEMEEWYQVYSPKQADYPAGVTSYVNYAKFSDETMSQRAAAVKDAIKGFDGSYQYRLYEFLIEKATTGEKPRFNLDTSTEEGKKAKALLDAIQSYIVLQRKKNAYDQEKGYELAWENFMLKLEEQVESRESYQRVIPWGSAIGFLNGVKYDEVKELYEIGGACYYGNKTK